MIYRTWEEPLWEPDDAQPPWLSKSIAEQIELNDTSITIHDCHPSTLKSLLFLNFGFKSTTRVIAREKFRTHMFAAAITFTDLDITPALQASSYDFLPEQNHTPESIVAMLYDKPPRFAAQLTNYIRDTRPKSIITHDAGMVFILSDSTPTTAPA